MQSTKNKIFFRIAGRGRGWAFSSRDFVPEFSRDQIDNALSDLTKEEKIRRVCRGIYDYPKYSDFLHQYLSPDFDQVAQAISRKNNWRIQPSGDAALNLLGISTQVPGRIIYYSDGPNRTYSTINYDIEFKKTILKNIGFKCKESGILVYAIKALGKDQMENIDLDKFRANIDLAKRDKILKDTRSVTTWIQNYIKKICDYQ